MGGMAEEGPDEDVRSMQKRNRSLRVALDHKCEARGSGPVARDVHILRVQQAMLLAEKHRLQAALLGGERTDEDLKDPRRAKDTVIGLGKRDSVARAISQCIDRRVGEKSSKPRSTNLATVAVTVPKESARQGAAAATATHAAPAESPPVPVLPPPPPPTVSAPANDVAGLAARRASLKVAQRQHDETLKQLDAEERALAAESVARASAIIADTAVAVTLTKQPPPKKRLFHIPNLYERSAGSKDPPPAVVAESAPKNEPPPVFIPKAAWPPPATTKPTDLVGTPSTTAGSPAIVPVPAPPPHLQRGVSERERRIAEASTAETASRLTDVTFDFSFGSDPGDGSGANEPTGASTSPSVGSEEKARKRRDLAQREVQLQLARAKNAAEDAELGTWHGGRAETAEWQTQSEMNHGSENNNDQRILDAIARTNPGEYKEAKLGTLARNAGSKEARAQRAALITAEQEALATTSFGEGAENGSDEDVVLPEADYVLSMITSGLSEDSELTDFDGVRYHVNAQGQRVVRAVDRNAEQPEGTLKRRQQNQAAVETRKAAAQQRKQDAWLRSLKRGSGASGAASAQYDDSAGSTPGDGKSGYTPGRQAKLHDLLGTSVAKRSELGASKAFVTQRAAQTWMSRGASKSP